MPAKLLQSCPTPCEPMDSSPPGSSVHGILQARILEWVAMPSSRGSSWPGNRTHVPWVSCVDRQILYSSTTLEAQNQGVFSFFGLFISLSDGNIMLTISKKGNYTLFKKYKCEDVIRAKLAYLIVSGCGRWGEILCNCASLKVWLKEAVIICILRWDAER